MFKRRHLLALGLAASVFPARAQTQRLVSVGSALTEIVYGLRAEKMLVGVDTTSLHPEAARPLRLRQRDRQDRSVGRVTGKIAEAQAMVAQGRAEMASLAAKLASTPAHLRVLFLLSMGGGAPQAAGCS